MASIKGFSQLDMTSARDKYYPNLSFLLPSQHWLGFLIGPKKPKAREHRNPVDVIRWVSFLYIDPGGASRRVTLEEQTDISGIVI